MNENETKTKKPRKKRAEQLAIETLPAIASTGLQFNPETLISQGIAAGVNVDSLERLLAMRREVKAEWAQERFDVAMSTFQSACPQI